MEPEVEGEEPLPSQAFRHVAFDDAAGEALDDSRLAHTGLADKDGVVLGPPREDLDDPADFLVPADDRVELALAGLLGQVTPVLLERLVALLGVLAGDPVAAPDLPQRVEQVVMVDAHPLRHGQQDVLDREVLVAERLPLAARLVQNGLGLPRQRRPLAP